MTGVEEWPASRALERRLQRQRMEPTNRWELGGVGRDSAARPHSPLQRALLLLLPEGRPVARDFSALWDHRSGLQGMGPHKHSYTLAPGTPPPRAPCAPFCPHPVAQDPCPFTGLRMRTLPRSVWRLRRARMQRGCAMMWLSGGRWAGSRLSRLRTSWRSSGLYRSEMGAKVPLMIFSTSAGRF